MSRLFKNWWNRDLIADFLLFQHYVAVSISLRFLSLLLYFLLLLLRDCRFSCFDCISSLLQQSSSGFILSQSFRLHAESSLVLQSLINQLTFFGLLISFSKSIIMSFRLSNRLYMMSLRTCVRRSWLQDTWCPNACYFWAHQAMYNGNLGILILILHSKISHGLTC